MGIIIGTLLLCLPESTVNGIPAIDAFFVAVSSICVTGLSTVNIGATFTPLGQIILLILIEVGGLGVITFSVLLMVLFGQRISLTNRMLIQNAYNTDSMSGLIRMTKRIIKVSCMIEGLGALAYCFVFVPEYGPVGIWYGIFHSVSAYCNAGIDLLGGNSLVVYRDNLAVNLITMSLIVAGGLGFPVYWEIWRLITHSDEKKHQYRKKMSIRAKMVLVATAVLILGGALVTLVFEWNNPLTIGELPFGKKVLASFFQSVTLRTAGFATIDQSGFTPASCMIYIVLMLIGGSPSGTAGGIKTVTVLILIASMFTNIKGGSQVNLFHRQVTDAYVRTCSAIATFSVGTLIILTSLLMFVQGGDFLDTFYEMSSAVATVGLSRGLTGDLNHWGKLIVCLTMYLGRIGPITMALAFNYKKPAEVSYADDKITIG